MAALMIVRNEYGRPERTVQVCSRCKEEVKWVKHKKVWSPIDPETGRPHICKEAIDAKNTD